MEQRDYLLRQIEQFGRVLGKMIADLIQLRSQGAVNEYLASLDLERKAGLHQDIDELLDIPAENLISVLTSEKKLSNAMLGELADLLMRIAGNHDAEPVDKHRIKGIYQRCVILYQYLDKEDNTFSFERQEKIEWLRNQ
jgi:hypothetical protein